MRDRTRDTDDDSAAREVATMTGQDAVVAAAIGCVCGLKRKVQFVCVERYVQSVCLKR